MKRVLGLFLFYIIFVTTLASASDWGAVQPYEFKTKVPAPFDTLGAAVLFDNGEVTVEQSGLALKRSVRVIVLDSTGVDRFQMITIETDALDHIGSVKAVILSPDSTTEEIPGSAIKKSDNDSKRIVHIHFDRLKPGDIIEYQYQIDYYGGLDKLGIDKYLLFSQNQRLASQESFDQLEDLEWNMLSKKQMSTIPTWYFDSDLYTFSSTLSVKLGGEYDYNYFTTNVPEERRTPTVESIDILSATIYQVYSWFMENIPPAPAKDPDAVEPEAQRSAVHFRLLSTDGLNRIVAGDYSPEHWQYVGQSFQGYVLEYARTDKSLRKKARELTADKASDMDKLEALYDYIADNFSVDATYDLRPLNPSLKQLFKKKKGKPFELNLLLVEMLKIAQMKAAPILISTRDKISFEKTGRFNHMITRVNVDGKDILVDVSSTECPLGRLPKVSMVTEGVGIEYDNSGECEIVPIGCE